MSNVEQRLPDTARRRQDRVVAEELPDDATLIMEVLFDIRRDTAYIIELLEEENGKEEAEDS